MANAPDEPDMDDGSEPDDTEEQRTRYRELLEELRTIIPGVQILFAFLLVVPFNKRFPELDDLGVQMFTVSLVSASLAAVVLMAPVAYHRIHPGQDRSGRIRFGGRQTVIGMALLGVSMGSAVFVVVRMVFKTQKAAPATWLTPTSLGAAIGAFVALTVVGLWYLLPLSQRR